MIAFSHAVSAASVILFPSLRTAFSAYDQEYQCDDLEDLMNEVHNATAHRKAAWLQVAGGVCLIAVWSELRGERTLPESCDENGGLHDDLHFMCSGGRGGD